MANQWSRVHRLKSFCCCLLFFFFKWSCGQILWQEICFYKIPKIWDTGYDTSDLFSMKAVYGFYAVPWQVRIWCAFSFHIQFLACWYSKVSLVVELTSCISFPKSDLLAFWLICKDFFFLQPNLEEVEQWQGWKCAISGSASSRTV